MKKKLLFWVPHVLLLFFMVGSAIFYFVDPVTAGKAFMDLGYPVYAMYFNAIAKILGGIAIVAPVSKTAKEWAYAGYLFIILLATQAVWMSMPGIPWPFAGFIAIWAWAYYEYKKA